MNPNFQKPLSDDDSATVAAFIRGTPGQLDCNDIKKAPATAFQQNDELKLLLRDIKRTG